MSVDMDRRVAVLIELSEFTLGHFVLRNLYPEFFHFSLLNDQYCKVEEHNLAIVVEVEFVLARSCRSLQMCRPA